VTDLGSNVVLRKAGIALAIATAAAGLTALPAHAAKHPDGMDIRAGSAHGAVPAKGAKSQSAGARRSPDMLFHNGAIMTTANVTPIYWGRSWASSTFVDDKMSGLASFYTGYKDSNYAKASDEYTGTNGQVAPTTTFTAGITDTAAAPTKAPSTTAILNEVAKWFPKPVKDGYYPVYVDTKRGNAGYCAWHSSGTINGLPVVFAFFFNLDGDPGCDPGNQVSAHHQGVAALANVSAHELSEARTDPANGGWYDSSGGENGDKCAWTFNKTSVTFSDQSQWTLQGEWSNAAYDSGTGYPNSSGQKGCLDGSP
jgi:hypothetical protein